MNRKQREKEFDEQRVTLREHQLELQTQLKELKVLQTELKAKQHELQKKSNQKYLQNIVPISSYNLHFADFLKNWWK